MPDKKLTDSEITNNLEWLKIVGDKIGSVTIGKEFIPTVIDLINRLQKDKEYYKKCRNECLDKVMFIAKQCDELQAENERMRKGWKADAIRWIIADAKAEAYKECIEKVKTYFRKTRFAYDAENLCEELDSIFEER